MAKRRTAQPSAYKGHYVTFYETGGLPTAHITLSKRSQDGLTLQAAKDLRKFTHKVVQRLEAMHAEKDQRFQGVRKNIEED